MKKDVQDFKTDRGSAEGNYRSGPITGYPAAADSGMAVLVTVNGREFCRVREALAGCRGAALTRVFVMPARARYYKHTSCPVLKNGCRRDLAGFGRSAEPVM